MLFYELFMFLIVPFITIMTAVPLLIWVIRNTQWRKPKQSLDKGERKE